MPVPYLDMPARLPLGVDGTLAGRAYRTGSPVSGEGADEATRRLWLPLREGSERLGVLEATVPAPDADALTADAALFADLVAMLVATQWPYGDVFELVRRVRPMRLPAEIQWRLLPPTTLRAEGVSLSGLLEPWDEVGGDAFDYALNDGRLHVALFDAMGHGLGATLLSTPGGRRVPERPAGPGRPGRLVRGYRRRARHPVRPGALRHRAAARPRRGHRDGALADRRAPAAAADPARAGGHAAAGPAGHAVRAAVHRRPPAGAHAAARTAATGSRSTPTAWSRRAGSASSSPRSGWPTSSCGSPPPGWTAPRCCAG